MQVKIERGSLILFYLLVIITPQSTSIWSTKTYKIEKKKKMKSDFWSYFLFWDFGLWFFFRRLAKISFWAWNKTPTGNHFPACFSRFSCHLFQEDLTVSSLLWGACVYFWCKLILFHTSGNILNMDSLNCETTKDSLPLIFLATLPTPFERSWEGNSCCED